MADFAEQLRRGTYQRGGTKPRIKRKRKEGVGDFAEQLRAGSYAHRYPQPRPSSRPAHQLYGRLQIRKTYARTGPRDVRKQTMLDRIVLRRIRRVVCHAHL